MKNETYWMYRVARQMFEYVEEAEKTNQFLRQGYKDATEYLQKEAKQVFETFQSRYGLTQKEAETLLKTVKNPQDIRMLKTLLQSNPSRADLLAELESGAYGNRLNNLANMMGQVDKVCLPMATTTLTAGQSLFTSLAEQSYYQTIFNIQQYAGYGWDVKKLSERNIQTVLDTVWSGKDFSTTVWENTDALADAVKRELLINTLTGRSLKKASDSLAERMQAGYNNSRRVIRTESTYVCNEMQRRGYETCGVRQYIYVAILDLKTSKMCRELDKTVHNIDDAKAGINYPPMHPYCRSTTIAKVNSEVLHRMKQRALDPSTGKHVIVPADMKYHEWYRKFVLDKEEDITVTREKERLQRESKSNKTV